MADDISDDIFNKLVEESMAAHSALMVENKGNTGSAHSIVRLSAARQFNETDPIEAAAVDMIMSGPKKS